MPRQLIFATGKKGKRDRQTDGVSADTDLAMSSTTSGERSDASIVMTAGGDTIEPTELVN